MCLHWQQMNDCTQSINYQYGFTMHFDSRQVIENMETQYTMRLRWQHSKNTENSSNICIAVNYG